jgi:hypothetical protein
MHSDGWRHREASRRRTVAVITAKILKKTKLPVLKTLRSIDLVIAEPSVSSELPVFLTRS